MKDRSPRFRRRRQSPTRFFLTALAIAVVIFAVAEVVQHPPWKGGGGRGRAPASATAALPVTADELGGFQVFLRRGGCGGGCPYYALDVGGGKLQYVGVRDVARQGTVTVPAGEDLSRRLLKEVEQASFFSLADSYDLTDSGCEAARTDAPNFTLGVTLNGETKVVKANMGCTNVPKSLTELAAAIDRLTDSAQWTDVGRAPSPGT